MTVPGCGRTGSAGTGRRTLPDPAVGLPVLLLLLPHPVLVLGGHATLLHLPALPAGAALQLLSAEVVREGDVGGGRGEEDVGGGRGAQPSRPAHTGSTTLNASLINIVTNYSGF